MITSVGHSRPDKRIDTKLNDNRHGDDGLVIDEIGSKRRIFFIGIYSLYNFDK